MVAGKCVGPETRCADCRWHAGLSALTAERAEECVFVDDGTGLLQRSPGVEDMFRPGICRHKSKDCMHFLSHFPEGALADDETYARAVMRHTDQVLGMFVGERLINKIFGRVFQSHAMGRLVIAHFEWKANAAHPPTLAWLQEETGGGRTLAAFIGVAKATRLVSGEPNAMDRRQKILVPGARIIDGLRDWLYHHLCLAETMGMVPAGCPQRLRDDTQYFERLVRSSAVVIEGVAVARRRYRLWDWFEQRESGLRMAYALLRAHYSVCLERRWNIHAPADLDVSGGGLAQLLAISKSHVRNVLNGAEKLGILSHDATRRRIRLSAAFLQEARECFVNLMTLFAQAHLQSEALAGPGETPGDVRS